MGIDLNKFNPWLRNNLVDLKAKVKDPLAILTDKLDKNAFYTFQISNI